MIRETPDIAVIDETMAIEAPQPSRLRRVAAGCGKLATLGVLASAAGVGSLFWSETETDFGPHDASVELTMDSSATFDLGPIGSIIVPVEESRGVGAHITIGEVPAQGAAADKIEEYARSLANIEDDLHDIRTDLAHQALRNSLLAGGGLAGLYVLMGGRRREELASKLEHVGPKAAVAGMIAANLMLATFVGLSETSAAASYSEPVDATFDGTPLEGARVTGYLPELINSIGKDVIDQWRANDEFYDEVSQNLQTAFEESNTLTPRDGYPIMLFYTDLHCNVGMARIIGETAEHAGVSLIADGGDTTMGGTTYEEFCIQILASEVPVRPIIGVGGNHDSRETESQQRANDFRMLNGEAIAARGLRVLGDDDVRRSAFGEGMRQEGEETIAELGERLAETACADPEGVDILLVHEPDAATESIARGCVTTALTGHMHHEAVSVTDRSLFITGDNASGATNDRPSLGPVDEESPARIYLIKFDESSGQPIGYQTVTVHADAHVEIGRVELVSTFGNR